MVFCFFYLFTFVTPIIHQIEKNKDGMKDRIAHIMRAKNLKASDFAALLGIQPSGVSHILAGRNNPSLEFIKKIKETFPEYNLDWIIFGTGPMTLSEPYRESFSEAQKEVNRSLPEHENSTFNDLLDVHSDDASPSLFDVESPEVSTDPVASPSPSLEPSSPSSSSGLKCMIFVYEDGTFETFTPR